MVGILPVVIVGGLAMNMTERMMGQTQRPRRRANRRRRSPKAYARRSSGMGFGSFSNIGL